VVIESGRAMAEGGGHRPAQDPRRPERGADPASARRRRLSRQPSASRCQQSLARRRCHGDGPVRIGLTSPELQPDPRSAAALIWPPALRGLLTIASSGEPCPKGLARSLLKDPRLRPALARPATSCSLDLEPAALAAELWKWRAGSVNHRPRSEAHRAPRGVSSGVLSAPRPGSAAELMARRPPG